MSIILSADRRRVNSLSSRFGSKQKCCAESRVSIITTITIELLIYAPVADLLGTDSVLQEINRIC